LLPDEHRKLRTIDTRAHKHAVFLAALSVAGHSTDS